MPNGWVRISRTRRVHTERDQCICLSNESLLFSKLMDVFFLCSTTGETLRFTLAPEIAAEDIDLYSDYPAKDKQYKRDNYAVLKWTCKGKCTHWDPDRFVDVGIDRAGTFKFYFCKAGENKRWVCRGCIT